MDRIQIIQKKKKNEKEKRIQIAIAFANGNSSEHNKFELHSRRLNMVKG
jgi:hypothetical protein